MFLLLPRFIKSALIIYKYVVVFPLQSIKMVYIDILSPSTIAVCDSYLGRWVYPYTLLWHTINSRRSVSAQNAHRCSALACFYLNHERKVEHYRELHNKKWSTVFWILPVSEDAFPLIENGFTEEKNMMKTSELRSLLTECFAWEELRLHCVMLICLVLLHALVVNPLLKDKSNEPIVYLRILSDCKQ